MRLFSSLLWGARKGQVELTQILDEGQERTLAYLEAEADPKTDLLTIQGQMAGIQSKRVAPWTPVAPLIEDIDLTLDSEVFFYWHRPTNEWEMEFEIKRGSGTFAIPAIGLPSQPGGLIGARQVAAKGKLNSKGLILEHLRLETGNRDQAGPVFQSQISILGTDKGPEIAVRLETEEINRGDLFYIWPSSMIPNIKVPGRRLCSGGSLSQSEPDWHLWPCFQ